MISGTALGKWPLNRGPLNTGLTVKAEKFVVMSLILYDPDK